MAQVRQGRALPDKGTEMFRYVRVLPGCMVSDSEQKLVLIPSVSSFKVQAYDFRHS